MEKKTHNQVVLNYLRNHKKKGLTVKEASDKLGINRVENNICFLRKQGYVIEREDKQFVNKYGYKSTYGIYRLVEDE